MHARTPGNSRTSSTTLRNFTSATGRTGLAPPSVRLQGQATRRRGCGDQCLSINSLMDEATELAASGLESWPLLAATRIAETPALAGRASPTDAIMSPLHRKANDCETQYQVIWFFSTRDLFSSSRRSLTSPMPTRSRVTTPARPAPPVASPSTRPCENPECPASPILKVRLRHHNGPQGGRHIQPLLFRQLNKAGC